MAIRSSRFWPAAQRAQRDEDRTDVPVRRRKRRKRRSYSRRQIVGFVTVGVLGSLLLGTLSFTVALQIAERMNPSGRVYVDVEGEKVYLQQPSTIVTPPALGIGIIDDEEIGPAPPAMADTTRLPEDEVGVPDTSATDEGVAEASATDESEAADPPSDANVNTPETSGEPPRQDVPLPPVQLQIPSIEVDVSVILADNDNLPRQPYAGWLFKSAFPATAGNMVLLGHLNGQAAIFERLNELQPGDEIRVITQDKIHIYLVQNSQTVDDTAVEILAPTSDPVATLITCAGDWNPYERSYDKRLVVRASYAAVEDFSDAGH